MFGMTRVRPLIRLFTTFVSCFLSRSPVITFIRAMVVTTGILISSGFDDAPKLIGRLVTIPSEQFVKNPHYFLLG
jgi:hypothetical protein